MSGKKSGRKDCGGLVSIPYSRYEDVRVDWPIVGTRGVVIDADVKVLYEELCQYVESMRSDWIPENLEAGGVFVDAAPVRLWDVDVELPTFDVKLDRSLF